MLRQRESLFPELLSKLQGFAKRNGAPSIFGDSPRIGMACKVHNSFALAMLHICIPQQTAAAAASRPDTGMISVLQLPQQVNGCCQRPATRSP